MQRLPFSADDLRANRDGRLSAPQLADLEAQLLAARHQAGNEVTQFAVVMLAIVAISFGAGLPSSWTMRLLILAVSMFAVYEYFNTAMVRRLAADVEKPAIQQIDGLLQLIEGPNQRYVLKVQSTRYRIRINARLFQALQPNTTYRLYVAAHSGALLSMEPLPFA